MQVESCPLQVIEPGKKNHFECLRKYAWRFGVCWKAKLPVSNGNSCFWVTLMLARDYSRGKCTFHWYWETQTLICARTELPLGVQYWGGWAGSFTPAHLGDPWASPRNLPGSCGEQHLALYPASKGWFTTGIIYRWGKPFHTWLPKCWLLFLNNSFSVATAPGVCVQSPAEPAQPRPAFVLPGRPQPQLHTAHCLNPSLDFDRRFVLFWFEKIPFYTNTFLGVILPNTSFFSYQLRIIRWCMYLISLLIQVV